MNYITPKEASEKWGISLRRVQTLCTDGRIPGVLHVGRQWMIPVTADRPSDRRTKDERGSRSESDYHFPIFVYSDSYVTRSGLSDDEQQLLEAQIQTLQGNFPNSVKLCRELAINTSSPSVRFGAYCTNLYNYMLLGLYSEMVRCQNHMEIICENTVDHKEDYKMLLAASKFEYSYDTSDLMTIDPQKLSPDALMAYECVTLLSIVFSTNIESVNAVHMYNITCAMLEKSGNHPAAMVFHGCLVYLCAHVGDTDGQRKHTEAMVRLGHTERYHTLLSKYMSLDAAGYLQQFKVYGNEFENKILNISRNNMKSWKLIYSTYKNMPMLPDYTDMECEVLLLLSQGLSRKRIGELKSLSQSKLNHVLDEISEKSGIQGYAELKTYAKEVYSMTD